MIELVLITLYFLSSSFIYGYYVLRRAFWVVRILEPRDRLKISFIYGLPFVAIFSILLWITSPLIVFTAFPFIIISASLVVERNPNWVMPLLLKHIDTSELMEEDKENPRIEELRQKLMASVQCNQEVIDRVVKQIEMFRNMVKSTEQSINQTEEENNEEEISQTEPNIIQVRNPDALYVGAEEDTNMENNNKIETPKIIEKLNEDVDNNLKDLDLDSITKMTEDALNDAVTGSKEFQSKIKKLEQISSSKDKE